MRKGILGMVVCAVSAVGAPDGEADRIGALVRELGSDDVRVRDAATDALRRVGAPAIPHLEKAARGEDLEVRSRSERLLQEVDDRRFEEGLLVFFDGNLGGDECARRVEEAGGRLVHRFMKYDHPVTGRACWVKRGSRPLDEVDRRLVEGKAARFVREVSGGKFVNEKPYESHRIDPRIGGVGLCFAERVGEERARAFLKATGLEAGGMNLKGAPMCYARLPEGANPVELLLLLERAPEVSRIVPNYVEKLG